MGKRSFFWVNLGMYVTPQINHLREIGPTQTVSTHISGVSQEIDGIMCIF